MCNPRGSERRLRLPERSFANDSQRARTQALLAVRIAASEARFSMVKVRLARCPMPAGGYCPMDQRASPTATRTGALCAGAGPRWSVKSGRVSAASWRPSQDASWQAWSPGPVKARPADRDSDSHGLPPRPGRARRLRSGGLAEIMNVVKVVHVGVDMVVGHYPRTCRPPETSGQRRIRQQLENGLPNL